ncbi:MAG: hypothetical protein U9Q22_05075 [Candidatus Altiarchaeota archaeon]|nr:hypothetical protein [Candidatus Altiarchaeota archaeon]
MHLGDKSAAGKGILLISSLVLMLSLFMVFAYQTDYAVNPDKGQYSRGEEVCIFVSGPGDTGFTVKIFDPEGDLVFEESGGTTGSGNGYLSCPGFSETGRYDLILFFDGDDVAASFFTVEESGEEDYCVDCKPATTSTTTSSTTSVISLTTTTATTTVSDGTVFSTTSTIDSGSATTVTTSTGATTTSTITQELGTKTPEKNLRLTAHKAHFPLTEEPEFEIGFKDHETGIRTIEHPESGLFNAEIWDCSGNPVELKPGISKSGNKYVIKIPAKRSLRPGLYKLVVKYNEQEEELWFRWGLVSLNTRKSIYRPGETAEFIIVVLNKDGHSVCNADISLTVTSPVNEERIYSTTDGSITADSGCGLYDTGYPTEMEGNHTIDITALIDGAEVNFSTYFMVKQNYEFNLIRTAQSKIDPTKQNSFDVRIDVESFTGVSSLTVKEFVPAEFDVISDADIREEGDTKILTWNKDLTEDKTSVGYSYSVPHIWPYLYSSGPAEIDYSDKTFTEARPWYVAVDPADNPNCTLISITPGDIEANSTGLFEAIINCTDPSGINVSKFLITRTVEGMIDPGIPNLWSIRPPVNDKAQNHSCPNHGDFPQILRADGRAEGKWWETYGLFNDNFTYAAHSNSSIHVTITNGSDWALLNYSWRVEPSAFRNSIFLSRVDIEGEEKKEYQIAKANSLLVKLWNLETMRNTSNYTFCVFKNIGYLAAPNKDLLLYYCNDSYDPGGGVQVTASPNCAYLDTFTTTDVSNIYYTSRNSSYSKSCYSIIDDHISGIRATDTGYIYYESGVAAAKPYLFRYANGSSGTNVSFSESGVSWTTTDYGATWTPAAFTPDVWVSSITDGDQFQLGIHVEDNYNNNLTDFTFYTDDIGDVNYHISSPNIEGYYSQAGGTDEDRNGTHSGDMTIRVNTASDPDAVGTVNHSLYLCNTDGSLNLTINDSFYSPDDGDMNITFNTTQVLDGVYKINVTARADDNPKDIKSDLTYENFTIDNTPPTWNETPANQVAEYGEAFSYKVNASDMALDVYSINDTTNFKINSATGLIENNTGLSLGTYGLNISVNDTSKNILSEIITVTVQDTTPPTWNQTPTNQTVEYGEAFSYKVNASDMALDVYFINDTTNFKINSATGLIENNTELSLGTYGLNISVNDTSKNILSEIITVTVQDTTPPTWNETPTDQTVEYGEAFSYKVNASDNVALDVYFINDTTNFKINPGDGLIENNTGLSPGIYGLNISVNDTSNNVLSQVITVSVQDNIPPTINGESVNETLIPVNGWVCLNVTVTDNFNVDSVWAEIDIPGIALNVNVTLLDDGSGCDSSSSDDVYSKEYQCTQSGQYNWTKTYANDSSGKLNTTYPCVNWSVTSTASTTVNMTEPVADLEIDESGHYNQACNVSCDSGSCENVVLYAQYDPGTWTEINTTTTDLVNSVNSYSCGALTTGESCNYTFNITAGPDSGNNTWEIRCKAVSTNAPTSSSAAVNLTINDMPAAIWDHPSAPGVYAHATEVLNATSSTDSDGTIQYAEFWEDSSSDYTSTVLICNDTVPGDGWNCTWNTSADSECSADGTCYLRLKVVDDDGASNYSDTNVIIDNTGPVSTLTRPPDNGNITADTYMMNASVTDSGVGSISWVMFEYRKNDTASWKSACNDTDGAPYNCTWNLTGLSDLTTYESRIRANDSLGNLGDYDAHTSITVDRKEPAITLNSPPPGFNTTDTALVFNFTAVDNLASTMNCSLYIDSVLNQTNETTENNTATIFNVAGIPEGLHNWHVNCSDSINSNVSETRQFTVDLTPPNWSKQNQTINDIYTKVVHRGESIKLTAYWMDNLQLSHAFLSTNETGGWVNKTNYSSPAAIEGTGSWSNFTWQNSSIIPGTNVGWRIYANDSAGNINVTGVMNFTVWGFSEVSDSNLNPATINQGESTTMSCRVTDNTTADPVENYTVYFYNSTGLMGENITQADGWAYWTFIDNSTGYETITCNITGNASLYYNNSGNNQAQETLNTRVTGAPLIYRVTSDPCELGTRCRDGIIAYNPNPDSITLTKLRDVWSTDKISSITQCCTPDGCNLTYCSETPGGTINFTGTPWTIQAYSYLVFWYEIINPTGAGSSPTLTVNLSTTEYGTQADDRTDVDIINKAACAWTAWNDTNGFDTGNATPNILTVDIGSTTSFILRLREFCGESALSTNNQVKVAVPSDFSVGTLDSRCSASGNTVTCNLTASLLSTYTDYPVELTASNTTGVYILQTNVTGTDANLNTHEDVNSHIILIKDLSPPTGSKQNQTIDDQYSRVVHRNESIKLTAYWTDTVQLDSAWLETNETGGWVNKTNYGSPTAIEGTGSWSDFTWQNSSISPGTSIGWRIYANDSAGNINVTGVMNFTVWGWSNLSWVSPSGGNYSQNRDIDLICRVNDATNGSGVQSYPVRFYRDGSLIGTADTNSSGYANYTWNTGSLSTGDYGLSCNITDNSSISYNDSTLNKGSTQITVDAEYPSIELQSPLSASYTADTAINFSFTVTDNLVLELNCSLYVDNLLKDTNESTRNNTVTALTATSLSPGEHFWNITCIDKALNQNWSATRNFTVYEPGTVNIFLLNSTGNTFENTVISIFDNLGQLISSKTLTESDNNLSDELASNQTYIIEIITPLAFGNLISKIRDINITGDLDINQQVVENYTEEIAFKNITALYALNDTGLSYELVELYIPKNNLGIMHIAHCTEWDFTNANCSSWELNHSSDYNMQENSTYIWFNVTEFDSFGGGAGNPLPNVTEIRVYDVTGLADTHSGGVLIGSGLNTTFHFYQRENRTYRVEIDVRNDASTQWTIAAEDDIYHDGLNSTWLINETGDIWYHEGGTDYEGGNWSNGRVTWNTSLGGKLTKGETGNFYYVFNMTSLEDEEYPVYFLVNDTSSSSGSYDNSVYSITRTGYLEVNLTLPPTIPGGGDAEFDGGYKVGVNKTFIINATVYCRDGYCGYVNGTLQYNLSSTSPDTPVNTTPGDKPFYVLNGINPLNCSTNPLSEDEFCSVNWTVNSTGDINALWRMDVLFQSNLSDSNDTDDVLIGITKVLLMSLSWSEISFGVCEPNAVYPAVLNGDGYNITLHENSNDADGIYIKGTDLDPQSVSGFGAVTYGIGVGNLSWNANENQYDSTNTSRLTADYELIKENVSSGSIVSTYYWINTPRGQYAQEYRGTLYILANASV